MPRIYRIVYSFILPTALFFTFTSCKSVGKIDAFFGPPSGNSSLSMEPSSLEFGKQYLGSESSPRSVTIKNEGNTPMYLRGISSSNSDLKLISTCEMAPLALSAGKSCEVTAVLTSSIEGDSKIEITVDYSVMPDGAILSTQSDANSIGVHALTFTGIESAQLLDSNTVEIRWEADPAAQAYFIFKSTGSQSPVMTQVGGNTTTQKISVLSGEGYTFRVRAQDSMGKMDENTKDLTLAVPGPSSAILSLSDVGNVFSFPNTEKNTAAAPHAVTVTNKGGIAATNISISGVVAPYSQTNNCPVTLAPGASCTITVSFVPNTAGTFTSNLEIKHNIRGETSGTNATLTEAIVGVGMGIARLSLSELNFTFPNTMVNSSSDAHTIVLQNTGTIAATNISFGTLSPQFSFTTSCPSTLAPNTNCNIVVIFNPNSIGNFTSTLNVLSNSLGGTTGTDSSLTDILAGTGQGPTQLVLSESIYNFPNTLSNTTAIPHMITLQNTGSVTATNLAFSGISAPFTMSTTCGSTLASNNSCFFIVNFSPVTSGSFSNSLNVAYNSFGGVGPANTNLLDIISGTGLEPAQLTLGESNFAFPNTIKSATSVAHLITVQNIGGVTATNINIGSLSSPFAINLNTCPSSLTPGSSCVVSTSFSPIAEGTFNQIFTTAYNATGVGLGAGTTINDALSGTGLKPASISISEAGFAFSPTVKNTNSSVHIVTLQNGGNLTASNLSFTGITTTSEPFKITNNTCGNALAANSSCSVSFIFSPTSAGNFDKTFTASFNSTGLGAGTDTILTDVFTGEGLSEPAELTIGETEYRFPSILKNTTGIPHTITLLNTGEVAATNIQFSGIAAPFFILTNTCTGVSLHQNQSCAISVEFRPTLVETSVNTLTISYTSGANVLQVTDILSGSGLGPAVLSLGETSFQFFSTRELTNSDSHIIYITNIGGTKATNIQSSGITTTGIFSILSNICTSELNPGAACFMVVRFTPPAAGAYTASLRLDYNDVAGATGTNAFVTDNLSGIGLLPANISIVAGGTDDATFSYSVVNETAYAFPNSLRNTTASKPHVITLRNIGNVIATNFSIDGLNTAPFATDSNCGSTLAPGMYCQVKITFTPTSVGDFSNPLIFTYSKIGAPSGTDTHFTDAISGIGVGPAELSYTQIGCTSNGDSCTQAFGNTTNLGRSSYVTLVVKNTGGSTATNIRVGTFSQNSKFSVANTCNGANVAANASCNVTVTFSPTDTEDQTDSLNITYNDAVNADHVLTLQATGKGVLGSFSITGPINVVGGISANIFWAQSIGATGYNVNISSTSGNCASTVGTPVHVDGETIVNAVVSATLVPGTRYYVCVTATEPSGRNVTATNNGTFYFDYNSPALLSFGLAETGTRPNYTWVFPQTIANSTPLTHTITITNSGTTMATGINFSLLAAPLSISSNLCGASIAAGASCSFTVRYNPTAGSNTIQILSITYATGASAGSGMGAMDTLNDTISGTAASNAALSFSPPSCAFGGVAVYTSPSPVCTLTLTNSGQTTATKLTFTGLSAPFTSLTNCGSSLAGNNTSCTLTVTYAPTAPVASAQTLSVGYSNIASTSSTNTTLTASISGTGLSASLAFENTVVTYDFGRPILVNTSATYPFIIRNSGGYPATNISVSAPASPFSIESDTCTDGSVAAAGTCTITVKFTPTAGGSFSGNMTISYTSDAGSGSTPATMVKGFIGLGKIMNTMAISAGAAHACALGDNGRVLCWGDNSHGQLGNPVVGQAFAPVPVLDSNSQPLTNVTSITAGNYHTCAVINGGATSGTAVCWGDNSKGELGNNDTGQSSFNVVPSQVVSAPNVALSGIKELAGGSLHTCARLSNGSVNCWGINTFGQLGNNSITSSALPVQVVSDSSNTIMGGVTAISSGDSHVCALISNASVYCWGQNNNGQVGVTLTVQNAIYARGVSGVTNVVAIAAGGSNSCAQTTSGESWCWGDNSSGQFGTGTTTSSYVPKKGIANGVSGISAGKGGHHTCAIANGTAKCAGANSAWQLGNTTSDTPIDSKIYASPPVGTLTLSGVTRIAAGSFYSCALAGGGVMCWGDNTFGEIGSYNPTTPSVPPVAQAYTAVEVFGL